MNVKQMVVLAAVLAVAVIFLLGLAPMGSIAVFGASGVTGVLTGISILFVGAVAAMIAIYWNKK
jgi:hypothetical protein